MRMSGDAVTAANIVPAIFWYIVSWVATNMAQVAALEDGVRR
ncbi:hypothetical protein MY5147_009000 [Beauveria neobassiana]